MRRVRVSLWVLCLQWSKKASVDEKEKYTVGPKETVTLRFVVFCVSTDTTPVTKINNSDISSNLHTHRQVHQLFLDLFNNLPLLPLTDKRQLYRNKKAQKTSET